MKIFDYSVLRIYQVFELFGMHLCLCMCELLYTCKTDCFFLIYKILIGIFSNYSSKIFFVFLLAPEKVVHEKVEEEIEMEVKGTVTNDVTLKN